MGTDVCAMCTSADNEPVSRHALLLGSAEIMGRVETHTKLGNIYLFPPLSLCKTRSKQTVHEGVTSSEDRR